MKVRTLIISILAVLVVSNVSLAQAAETPEQEPQEPVFQQTDSPPLPQPEPLFVAQATTAPTPDITKSRRRPATQMVETIRFPTLMSDSPTKMRIIKLRHSDAFELAVLIMNVFRIKVHPDSRSNRLVVNATEEETKNIMDLIEAMDVEVPEASTSRDVQNLVYRIYMFEIPSSKEGMKSFSMTVWTSMTDFSPALLDALADGDVQICEFLNRPLGGVPSPENGDAFPDSWECEILIQGKASNKPLAHLVDRLNKGFPETRVIELRQLKGDDEETFTNDIEAAQCTQLPERMQIHIKKLLGDDIRTVGYWFGNASVPGEVEAPIGPWMLKLRLNLGLDHTLELNVDVEMPAERHTLETQLGHRQSNKILSNMIRVKIGKPIIIGYNRESYGMRKMGAMVIIPEADSLQSDTADTNSF